jgi:Acetyltransferase (GNAT) domain
MFIVKYFLQDLIFLLQQPSPRGILSCSLKTTDMENNQRFVKTLFCKPSVPGIVYKESFRENPGGLTQSIAYRSLDLIKDLSLIHQWVNAPYAKSFWNIPGSPGLLHACYQCIMQNPNGHSFVGLLEDALICQFDVYRVQADELYQLLQPGIDVAGDEAGFHLIMAPIDRNNLPAKGLTIAVIRTFLNWYFSFPEATVMWAEPDINNARSIRLVKLLGFEYVKTVTMSYKTAEVYRLSREKWAAHKH